MKRKEHTILKYSNETCMNGMKQLEWYLPTAQTAKNVISCLLAFLCSK